MPHISQRGAVMPDSPIRKLVPFANKAKAGGVKVIHLNIGQPDLPTPEAALTAIRGLTGKSWNIRPVRDFSLREKLAAYYREYAIEVEAGDILITTGGSEAVTFAFMACLDPGDEIIVPEPAYANYTAFAIGAGAVIRTIPSGIDNGFALPPVAEFEKLITPRTRGIMICNPNNPTGYLYSRKEMEQIRDLVLRYDLFLFLMRFTVSFVTPGSRMCRRFIWKGSGSM